MHAEEVIALLQSLVKAHGNQPVVFKTTAIQSRPLGALVFEPYCKFWGGVSPNGHTTLVKDKAFVATVEDWK